MKKVGILTFHRALNYGAVLQTYALQCFLNKHGYKAEVIDYRCPEIEKNYERRTFKYRLTHPRTFISSILHKKCKHNDRKPFNRFLVENVPLSTKKFLPDNISETNKKYDYFIVGSDQVWSSVCTNMDATYFLDFVSDDEKKISYAASMGNASISDEHASVLKGFINRFAHVSVRESSTADTLTELLNVRVNTVLDPVFLLSRQEWSECTATEKAIEKKPYIFLYMILTDEKIVDYAKKIARQHGCEIVCVSDDVFKPKGIHTVHGVSPFQWVSLVKNAEAVVTNSFHGSSFAIVFEKELHLALIGDLPINNRLNDLVSTVAETMVDEDGVRWIQKYNTHNIGEQIRISQEFLFGSLK